MASRRWVIAVRWEYRVVVHRGVEAGVIAKRPLRPGLAGLNVAFDHKVHVRRNFQINGLALHQCDGFFPDKPGK